MNTYNNVGRLTRLAAGIGVPAKRAASYWDSNDICLAREPLSSVDAGMYSYRAVVHEYPSSVAQVGSTRLGTFDAVAFAFPAQWMLMKWRHKIPSSAQVFAITPTQLEQQRHWREFEDLDFDHADGALGYILFFLAEGATWVLEIQSDVYGQGGAPQKARYRDWHKVLALLFLDYVAVALPSVTRVMWVDASYIFRRFEGIDAGLARRLYVQLPRALGLSPVTGIDAAFDPAHRPLRIECGWAIDVQQLATLRASLASIRHITTIGLDIDGVKSCDAANGGLPVDEGRSIRLSPNGVPCHSEQ